MEYAPDQVISFTLDPTGAVVEFESTDHSPDHPDSWILPLIGWAVVSQPAAPGGGARTSLEPVVLQDEQFAVTVNSILTTLEATFRARIHHET